MERLSEMSILSRIRSWFGRPGNLSIAPSLNETYSQEAIQVIKEQDSKIDKIEEPIRVAYQELPRNDPVQTLDVQPENTPVLVTPKSEDNTTIQNIQGVQYIQPIQPIQPESVSSSTQSAQPEIRVKRSRRTSSNKPTRSRKKSKESAKPES